MDRGPITTVHSICDGEKLRPDRNNVALAALAEPIRSGRGDFCIFQLLFFITSSELLQTFLFALTAAGFCSWVGGPSDSTKWLVKKWGDVYLHETVISHIRRLLDDDFACRRLGETVPQFTQRMHKVADYMNSPAFAATDGRGLQGLAAQLHTRCQWVVRHKGQRYPK